MSVDIFGFVEINLVPLLTGILTVVGLYRAFEIRRYIVGPVYKSRANWTIALIIALLFLLVSTGTNIPYVSWQGGTPGVFVMVFALVLFIDSNVRVAMESDFFHRDILHWGAIGKPLVVLTIGYGLIGLLLLALFPSLASPSPNSPPWTQVGLVLFFAITGVVLCIGAAGLIIGARRTQDNSMKKFVRMIGLSVVCLAMFFTLWIPLSIISVDLGNVVSTLFAPFAAYFIYRAVMSLSPLGRLEKESEAETSTTVVRPGPPTGI